MKVILKNARLSFHDLFEARGFQGGDPKFSGTFICGPETTVKFARDGEQVIESHEVLTELTATVLSDKFGKGKHKADNWFYNKADGSTTRNKFSDKEDEYRNGVDSDTWYVTAAKREDKARNGKMTILDQRREAIDANSGLIYSGCYVNVILDVFGYEGGSGKGVTASLEAVQLLKDGESLAGGKAADPASDFDDEEIEASDLM